MVPLQVVAIVFVGLGAVAVVAARDLIRQAIVLSIYGFGLVLLFLVYQAPDVALSALVVSGVAYPFVLVTAIARVRALAKREPEET
jgi:energy-converting hydrogenase B subunit D